MRQDWFSADHGVTMWHRSYATAYIGCVYHNALNLKSPCWCTRESTTWHQITSPATAYQAAPINVVPQSRLVDVQGNQQPGTRLHHQLLHIKQHQSTIWHQITSPATAYKAASINDLSPDYITSYCISSSSKQRRSTLRSADKGNLIEPKTVTSLASARLLLLDLICGTNCQ